MVTDHLQQRQVSHPYVVVVDFNILPADISKVILHQSETFGLVVDEFREECFLRRHVKTEIKLSCKQIYAHDAKDQPEDETDEQHVKDGWDRSNQGVHHHLERGRQVQREEDS